MGDMDAGVKKLMGYGVRTAIRVVWGLLFKCFGGLLFKCFAMQLAMVQVDFKSPAKV